MKKTELNHKETQKGLEISAKLSITTDAEEEKEMQNMTAW